MLWLDWVRARGLVGRHRICTRRALRNAAAATAEKGQMFIDHAARQIVALLRDVDALPLSVLENPADPSAP